MVFVNDNDNRCISGVFGWDFGLVLTNVFCFMCSPVEHYFHFYLIFFLYEFENVPMRSGFGVVLRRSGFGVVSGKNVVSQIEWFVFIILVPC